MTVEKEFMLSVLSREQIGRNRSAATQSLENLLNYAEYDSTFARDLCTRVVNKFGDDEELSSIIRGLIVLERVGRKPGPRRKWTNSKLVKIYSEFKFMMDRGLAKNKVFGQLADEYGFHEYNHNRRNQIKENVNRGKKLAENLRFKF